VVRHRADIRLIEQVITLRPGARRSGNQAAGARCGAEEITDKTVDAVAMVGPPTEPEIASLVGTIDQVTDGTVGAEVSRRRRRCEAAGAGIDPHVAGTFGGRPPRPLEDVGRVRDLSPAASTGLDVSRVPT
jgi:hypothetical protein